MSRVSLCSAKSKILSVLNDDFKEYLIQKNSTPKKTLEKGVIPKDFRLEGSDHIWTTWKARRKKNKGKELVVKHCIDYIMYATKVLVPVADIDNVFKPNQNRRNEELDVNTRGKIVREDSKKSVMARVVDNILRSILTAGEDNLEKTKEDNKETPFYTFEQFSDRNVPYGLEILDESIDIGYIARSLSVLSLFSDAEVGEDFLPSYSYPSDHISVVAELQLIPVPVPTVRISPERRQNS